MSRCWWTQATASTGDCCREYAPCFPDWLSVGCEASFIAQYKKKRIIQRRFGGSACKSSVVWSLLTAKDAGKGHLAACPKERRADSDGHLVVCLHPLASVSQPQEPSSPPGLIVWLTTIHPPPPPQSILWGTNLISGALHSSGFAAQKPRFLQVLATQEL